MEAQPTTSETKITTVKQKDPKRVEMGKKLAAMSKAARDRKKQLADSASDSTHSDSWRSYDIDYGYLIGLAGLAIAVGSLYYSRLEYARAVAPNPSDGEQTTVSKTLSRSDDRKTCDFIEL